MLLFAVGSAGSGAALGAWATGSNAVGTSTISQVCIWLGLVVAVIGALFRANPPGFWRFQPADILSGLSLGILLRLTFGLLQGANQNAFPVTTGVSLPIGDPVLNQIVPAVLVAPLLEEVFFRGVVLVCLYHALRRIVGNIMAAVSASLLATGSFTLLHAVFTPLSGADAAALTVLSATSALLVILTGRIWGAVVLHAVYNLTYVLVAISGQILA